MALADEFYAGEQFDDAGTWLDKVLAIDPENIQGLLARGAVYFNLNDLANAETTWKTVADTGARRTSRPTTTWASST